MKSRSEEIFDEELSIRQGAIRERRRLSPFEVKHLVKLSREAREIQEVLDAERQAAAPVVKPVTSSSHGAAPRDPATLPASMRPGARGND